jgi:Phosphatidylserine/phosphatidylglycerophosphate/cardiolipin synthases and related enzymes
MINLIITTFGIVLVIGGFYAMYNWGFATPPNILGFFIGLLLAVVGMMLVVLFGGRIESGNLSGLKMPKNGEPSKNTAKVMPKMDKKQDVSMKKPMIAKKPREIGTVKNKTIPEAGNSTGQDKTPMIPRKINPKRVPKNLKEPSATKEVLGEPKVTENPKNEKLEVPVAKNPVDKSSIKSPKAVEKKPKRMKKVKPVRPTAEDDDEFVKNRLNRLKESYIKNTKDIENLIEERLDSFKGTLDQIKSESKDPSIIWSFDAGEVQETMKDTILKANNRILMMYPWIRNVDVSVLKRFMETDSKMIIQEASLDDDASVELIKLLMENNVEIRTMPHVHTVAIVSDAENGLIISTDPIYESFEVGVIYKDQKSIEEIERMFEEAWGLSQNIELGINQLNL